ncbi:MAG: FliM/FliN family flagellar motor switch protein [Phycisphaerales bacterium JB065]
MKRSVEQILRIEVPLLVQLAEREMTLGQVLELTPGTIIELPKTAEEELEILINNKVIGTGSAVKVGENFGIRVNFIGKLADRIAAMGAKPASTDAADEDDEAAALAEAMLEGQV